jgi:hypothetical protein
MFQDNKFSWNEFAVIQTICVLIAIHEETYSIFILKAQNHFNFLHLYDHLTSVHFVVHANMLVKML